MGLKLLALEDLTVEPLTIEPLAAGKRERSAFRATTPEALR